MSKGSKKDFDLFIEENYDKLVNVAKTIHNDPYDLVHHTYLRIFRLKGVRLEKVMQNPFGYFRRAMFIEGTRGAFDKMYNLNELEDGDIKDDRHDLSHAFLLENFQLAVDRLSWFDRSIVKLYCDGWNLTQVARESGIGISTIHVSLFRSREKLKKHFTEYYVK